MNRSVNSAAYPFLKIRDGSGNVFVRMRAEISGGIRISSWYRGSLPTRLSAKIVVKNLRFTVIAAGSFVVISAISSIASEVFTMDEKTFRQEAAFHAVMNVAKSMLVRELITAKEYKDFERKMMDKYQPLLIVSI